jgi:DNA-binding protein YbaB
MCKYGSVTKKLEGIVTEDLLRELGELQRYATGLQKVLAGAQAHAPGQVEATDNTGAVRVALDGDGLPEAFRIDQRWKQILDPENFSHAVLESFQVAMGQRMAEWTASLEDRGVLEAVDQLQSVGNQNPEAENHDRVPPALRRAVAEASPRPIGELAEEVIKAFDAVPSPASRVTYDGTGANGKLRLVLSKSALVSCEVDTRWVSEQSATALMNALGQALAQARQALVEAPGEPQLPGRFDGLLAESFALLSDSSRLRGMGGGV